MTEQGSATNCDDLATLLKGLTAAQLSWVAARIAADSDVAACRDSGISQSTLRVWRQEGVPVNEIVLLIKQDSVLLGREMLRRLITKAVDALAEGLSDSKSRVQAATAILDRAGLVPQQKMDLTTAGQPFTDDSKSRLERKLFAAVGAGPAEAVPEQPDQR